MKFGNFFNTAQNLKTPLFLSRPTFSHTIDRARNRCRIKRGIGSRSTKRSTAAVSLVSALHSHFQRLPQQAARDDGAERMGKQRGMGGEELGRGDEAGAEEARAARQGLAELGQNSADGQGGGPNAEHGWGHSKHAGRAIR
eukprot:3500802-Rhodomonas_salina.2